MHKHELFLRSMDATGQVRTLPYGKVVEHTSKEPLDAIIELVDQYVKSQLSDASLLSNVDAMLYKVDGVCEYMISREFFLYPNTPEWWNDRKNPSKGQQRRDRFQSKGPRGPRSPQS